MITRLVASSRLYKPASNESTRTGGQEVGWGHVIADSSRICFGSPQQQGGVQACTIVDGDEEHPCPDKLRATLLFFFPSCLLVPGVGCVVNRVREKAKGVGRRES